MNEQPRDWLEQLAGQLDGLYPKGELIVSSGHSPSGTYHIGTLREIMTASAIVWALRRIGRKARHVDFVDDFDAFRKVPKFVPDEWAQYLGRPLAVVPDPFRCHRSYGEHFLRQLHEGLAALGAMPDETVSGYVAYRDGKLGEQVALALDKLDVVRGILTEVGGRQLDEHWSPVQILDEQQNLRTLTFAGWNSDLREVTWRSKDGATGIVGLDTGRVKLDWRLDWPARWAKWGVRVEPFGRDHATKGGSYDTGKVLVDKIFGGVAPFPVPYEFINMVGETKKMSKSTGNVLTPGDVLEVMPPEILRYFVVGPRPGRTLNFDSGLGLYGLIDEYAKARASELTVTAAYAEAGLAEETISRIPFNHLVAVFQAAREDVAETRAILERTGFETEVREQWPVIERELVFVKNWLGKYAPASVQFAVQNELPKVELVDGQRVFLGKLADTIEVEKDLNGQGMHDAIYAAAEVADLKPGQAFVALYRVILGQDSGPKAGWFLASLDGQWLVGRLRQGSKVQVPEDNSARRLEVELPNGRTFKIDDAVHRAFPDAVAGYVVADIAVSDEGADWQKEIQASLGTRKISKDELAKLPEISAWREVYRQFGVKPSDYRSSVEALVRRALDGRQVHVNSIVDIYNCMSVKHLLPMGAMDLDHVVGDITLRFGRAGETAELLGIEKPVIVTDKQVVYGDEKRIITWLWNYRDAQDTAVTSATKRAIFFVDGLHGREKVMDAVSDLIRALEGHLDCKVLASGCLPE